MKSRLYRIEKADGSIASAILVGFKVEFLSLVWIPA